MPIAHVSNLCIAVLLALNEGARCSVMESFPEREREVILHEIRCMREAIHDGDGNSLEVLSSNDEESSFEENLIIDDDSSDFEEEDDDNDEDSSSLRARYVGPWHAVDEVESDSSIDEKEYLSSVVQKAQASVAEDSFHASSASNVDSDESFVRTKPVIVDACSVPVSVIQKAKRSQSTAVGIAQANSSQHVSDTRSIEIGSLEKALQLNRQYQEMITNELMKIDAALRNSKDMQAEIENQSYGPKNPNMLGYSFFGRFRPTYFKDSFGQGPPENEDSKKRNALKAVHPFIKPQKAWREKERNLLAEAVRNQNLEKITLQLKQRLNELVEEGNDVSSIRAVKKQLEDLKTISPEELEKPVEDLDFHGISRLYLPERTEQDCRVRWYNLEHPAINHSKWTKEEKKRLNDLAKKYNKRHWEKVAQELGTNRTPVQCFQHFQRTVNMALSKSPWTPEEDKKLMHAVKTCTKGNWLQVSAMVEGRTPSQCLSRYDKCLKPGLRKGQWSKEENELLLKYARLYGPGQWKKISDHIPGRSDTSVRERWVNNYDPSVKLRRKWSRKEDIMLQQAVDRHGVGRWTKISQDLPGRTDNMCWRRWKTINNPESADYCSEKVWRNQVPVGSGSSASSINATSSGATAKKVSTSTAATTPTQTAAKAATIATATGLAKSFEVISRSVATTDGKTTARATTAKAGAVNATPSLITGSSLLVRDENWKPRHYRYKLADGTEKEEVLLDVVTANSEGTTEMCVENAEAVLNNGPKQTVRKEIDEASFDENSDIENQAEDDSDYEPEGEIDLADNEELVFSEPKNEEYFEEGERIVGRFSADIVSYTVAEGDLRVLRSRILDLENKSDKKKLIHANTKHIKELSKILTARIESANTPVVKTKRPSIRIDINDTVYAPENIGARSIRPVNVSHMPVGLAPFTVLLEVFRIDYNSIMRKLQASTSKTTPSSSTTVSSISAPSAGSTSNTSASTSSPATTSSSATCCSTTPSSLTSSSTASVSSAYQSASAARPSSLVAPAPSSADHHSASIALPSSSAASSPSSIHLQSSSKAPPLTAVTSKGSSLTTTAATGTRTITSIAKGKSGATLIANEGSKSGSRKLSKKNGRMRCLNGQTTATGVVPVAPQIIPIAPNVVTMRAFKKLLMHREKLEEISKRSQSNQSSDALSSMPTNGALRDSSRQSTSFANTHDYNVLSSRFDALFMWPLLLSTHEARSINDNALSKELVSAQRENLRAEIPSRTVVQQLRPDSKLSARHELVCSKIVRADPQILANEKSTASELYSRKIQKNKPTEAQKKGKKRSLQSLSDSDSSEDSSEADVSSSSKSLSADFADSVSTSKESPQKRKNSKSR